MGKRELRIKPQSENNTNTRKERKMMYSMKEKMMYEMTINNILNPLLEIVYEYKASNAYNYVPGTSKDSKAGWDYYGNKFKAIFKALNANIFLNKEQYNCIYAIVEGLFSFTRKFEYANGLPDFFFDVNENLSYYQLAFTVPKDQRELFREKVNGMPTDEEMSVADNYHLRKRKRSNDLNLKYDEEDFFVEELAYAVRRAFQSVFDLL